MEGALEGVSCYVSLCLYCLRGVAAQRPEEGIKKNEHDGMMEW